MLQGYCPPLTVIKASKNQIEQTKLFLIGSSLFIKSVAISASFSSPKVETLSTLYSQFSLNPSGFQLTLSTFSFNLCNLPLVSIVLTFILDIFGMCSLRSLLLILLTLVQSFLTVIYLNLVLYWLCQVLKFFLCFLVNVRVLATLFLRLSPILMFLEMKSLLVTLVFPSTTTKSSQSFLLVTCERSQHLICPLLKRLKKVSGIFSYSSCLKSHEIHSLSSILKSSRMLRSISIVDVD